MSVIQGPNNNYVIQCLLESLANVVNPIVQ
jgi:hypothetical protein